MAKPSLNYYEALHVGKVKTDVIQYTTIQGAIDAIGENTDTKPYAVYVHPGTYTEQITMEDYVDVIAVGGREETIITHTCTAGDQPTVTGENSMIKGFTIISDGVTATWATRCVSNAVDGFEIEDCILTPTGPAAAAVTFIATASCTMRSCTVDAAAAALTAVSLDTNTENYVLYDNLLGGETNSLLINNCLTTTISGGELYNLLDHDACATSTIARNVVFEEIDFDGGTVFELHACYVESIAVNTGGAVEAYGGTIRLCNAKVTAASFVWWLDDDNLHVLENMLIADALTAASAEDVIHLDPVRYAERITLVDGVSIEGSTSDTDTPTEIYDDTNAAVITAGAIECSIRRVKVFQDDATATSYCVSVTDAAVLAFSSCKLDCDGTYAIYMVNGNVTLSEGTVDDGGIYLGTAACTLTLDHTRIVAGDLVTASTVDHNITAYYTDFGGNNITNNADGATTIDLRYCSDISALTDAGLIGTTNIDNSIILTATKSGTSPWWVRLPRFGALSNTNGVGAILVYGGYVDSCADSTGTIVWYEPEANVFRVIAGMKIQHAIDAALAGDTIKIGPGTFTEALLFDAAADEVTLIGEGADKTILYQSNGTPVTFAPSAAWANPLCIQDLTIQGAAMDDDYLVHVNSATAAAELTMRNVVLYGARAANNAYGLYTSGDEDNDVLLRDCTVTMTGAATTYGIYSATDGANTYTIGIEYSYISSTTDDLNLTTDCTVNSRYSTYDGGGITLASDAECIMRCYNDTILATITKGLLAVMTYQIDLNLWVVINGMEIADALASAVAGDTVQLRQGVWTTDTNLSPATGVDIIGEGKEISVIDASDAGNPVFAIGNNISITIRGVTIDNDAAGGAITISPVANDSELVLEDCDVVNAGVSNCVVVSIGGDGNGTLTARRTDFTSDGANSIVVLTWTVGVGLPIFNSDLCSFTTSGGADNAAIEASASTVADVNVTRATFSGCTLAVYSKNANHTIDIDDSEFNNCGVELNDSAPVPNFTKCNAIGAFAHDTACTVTLRDCYVQSTYTIAAVAGVVNAYDTQFAAFINGGNGANITFQECFGTDFSNNSTSTLTIEGGNWDTVLQAATAGIINIYEANVATELDCSAGGAINAYNCHVATIDSNGGTVTLYGGVLLDVADATGTIVWWKSPRTLRVIDGTANMKIGDAIAAAIALTPAVDDPFTVIVAPGVYTEQVAMDDYVNVVAEAGYKVTTITHECAAAHDESTVTMESNCRLEGFTIISDGNGDTYRARCVTSAAKSDWLIKDCLFSQVDSAVVDNQCVFIDTSGTGMRLEHCRWRSGTAAAPTTDDIKRALQVDAAGIEVLLQDCETYSDTAAATDSDIFLNEGKVETRNCMIRGGGWYISDDADSIGVSWDDDWNDGVAPVVFAGTLGEFADLSGAREYTCLAGVTLGEAVYISAAETVAEATNTATPAEGVVVWKSAPAATTCYVKKHGYIYLADPGTLVGVAFTAGGNIWLGVTGAWLAAEPATAIKQVLGVAKGPTGAGAAKEFLINITLTNAGAAVKSLSIPIAWGAGSAPTGTHLSDSARRAVAIVNAAGQTVMSQAISIPADYLGISKLYVVLFPTATGTFDWTARTCAAVNGEDEATNANSATADTVAVVDNTIYELDITDAVNVGGPAYTMTEKDNFSIELTVDAMGGAGPTTQICVLLFRLEYTTSS